MMKSEFVALLKEISKNDLLDISHDDYCTVKHVYTYHPAIIDKRHVVNLYVNFGMTVINDMVDRADKCAKLEDQIRIAENELEVLRNQLSDLRD